MQQFDRIAEVQSDKATVEITSRYDGVIEKIHYAKGATAKVGEPLVSVKVDGPEPEPEAKTSTECEEPAKSRGASVQGPASAPPGQEAASRAGEHPTASDAVKAMPAVRHFARRHRIDLSAATPSGRSGQITKEDVLKCMQRTQGGDVDVDGASTVPLTAFQKAMVRSMQAALQIPHFGYHDAVDLTLLSQIRASLLAAVQDQHGVRITMMAFYIKALSLALAHHPHLNSHFLPAENALRTFRTHNVCIAISTDHGLAVPVIQQVERLSIVAVAQAIRRLTELARNNRLSSADLAGGTIALSNIGSIGGTTASPIIVPPQVCIVALGRVQTSPQFDEEQKIVARQHMPISWSADHRVVDGAAIAHFSNRWRALLEQPGDLLLHLSQP